MLTPVLGSAPYKDEGAFGDGGHSQRKLEHHGIRPTQFPRSLLALRGEKVWDVILGPQEVLV